MSKLPDWATRLDAYIAAAATMPFSYNSAMGLDCCSFTFGAIYAQTGIAVGLRFAGVYRTRRESMLTMKAYCGKASLGLSIAQLMMEHGFERIPPLMAQRGDVLLTSRLAHGDFFGVLDLNGRDVLSVGTNGVRRVPLSVDCRAWRIQ
jgi:hypothetical protein